MREMPVLAEGATQSPKKLLEVLAYAVDIRGIKVKPFTLIFIPA